MSEIASFIIPNSKLILIFETSLKTSNTINENVRRKLFLHWALANNLSSIIRSFFFEVRDSQLQSNDLRNFLHLKDDTSKTILHLAIEQGNVELMKYIIEADVDLNQTDSMNNTVLHLSLINEKQSSLNFLLEFTAKNRKLDKLNFLLKNKNNFDCLDLALNLSSVSAVYLLCYYGFTGDLLDKNNYLQKALNSSSDEKTKEKIIQTLIKCGANYTSLSNKIERFIVKNINESKIRNLVFEGGGVKGIGFVGALKNSLDKLFDWNEIVNIGGTSAGSITSALLAVGYSFREVEEIINNFKFLNLLDHDESLKKKMLDLKKNFHLLKFLLFAYESYHHMVSHDYALFDGKVLLDSIQEFIEPKLGKHATFQDLSKRIESGEKQFKYLFLIGSNLSNGASETFSHLTTPDMIISDAIRISMSIPFIWPPHKYYVKDECGNRILHPYKKNVNYVDGGLFKNYPIGLFDRKISTDKSDVVFINYETLGYRLRARGKQKNRQDECIGDNHANFASYVKSVLSFFMERENNIHVGRIQDEARSVYIDNLGVSSIDFDLDEMEKKALVKSGELAVSDYLNFKASIKFN